MTGFIWVGSCLVLDVPLCSRPCPLLGTKSGGSEGSPSSEIDIYLHDTMSAMLGESKTCASGVTNVVSGGGGEGINWYSKDNWDTSIL